MTPEALYWLGFLFADGHISKSNTLELCLSRTDIGHIEKFRAFLKSDYPIKFGTRRNTVLKIGTPGVVERARVLGLGARSLMRVPSSEMAQSRDFWRGAVDGDGTLYLRRNTISLTLIGGKAMVQAFASWAQLHCPRLRSVVAEKRHVPGLFTFSTEGKTAQELVALLYDGATVALDRKANLAAQAGALELKAKRPFEQIEDVWVRLAAGMKVRGAFAHVARVLNRPTERVYQRAKCLGFLSA